MTEDGQSRDDQKPGGDGFDVDRYVDRFIDLWEADSHIDVDSFCESVPQNLRDDVRAACIRYLQIVDIVDHSEGSEDPLVGQVIDRYRIEERLGGGGMGVVHRATHIETEQVVAIKFLRSGLLFSLSQRERFRREAFAAKRLEHPNIVRVHEAAPDHARPYLVMEFVEGGSLHDRLIRERESTESRLEDRLSWGLDVVVQVARALQKAHQNDIVHRDVKPHNILLGEDGQARLTDFGMAKASDAQTITKMGALMGTEPYMSPEQILAGRVPLDHRTDIYSLGVVLYELLTLSPPFKGETSQAILYEISFVPPISPRKRHPAIPRRLEKICLKAVEKNPRRRYQTIGEFIEDLGRFERNEPVLAKPYALSRPLLFVRRHPYLSTLSLGLISFLTMVGIVLSFPPRETRAFAEPTATLSVQETSGLAGARVYRRSLDPVGDVLGPRELLGRTPLQGLSIPIGPCRIQLIVEAPDHDFDGLAEWTLFDVREDTHHDVLIPLMPQEEVLEEMAWIEGGDVTVEIPINMGFTSDGPTRSFTGRVESFWIDVHEVTNEAYLEFLNETGSEAPDHWRELDEDAWIEMAEEYPDRPVVGVSVVEARAFAKWAGKRLPTLIEWAFVAGARHGSLFPWGTESDVVTLLADGERVTHTFEELTDIVNDRDASGLSDLQKYLRYSRGVDTCLASEFTDGGLHYLLGNASEMTESAILRAEGDQILPTPGVFYTKGASWFSQTTKRSGRTLTQWMPEVATSPETGFRCAVSILP